MAMPGYAGPSGIQGFYRNASRVIWLTSALKLSRAPKMNFNFAIGAKGDFEATWAAVYI